MTVRPWVLESGAASVRALGFMMGEITPDPLRLDPRAAGAQGGLVDARRCEGTLADVTIAMHAWQYRTMADAGNAMSALSPTGLFERAAHRMLIGPTVFHLFRNGGDPALTKKIMACVLDYGAEGN